MTMHPGDTPTGGRRRIFNPVQNDAVTFLETSEESGGECTFVELEVAPGGKVAPHYHLSHTESFRVLEGQLTVRTGDARHPLMPGQEATVPVGALHAWSNLGTARAVAHLEVHPGQPGSETSLRVAFGLSPPTVACSRTASRATRCTPGCRSPGATGGCRAPTPSGAGLPAARPDRSTSRDRSRLQRRYP